VLCVFVKTLFAMLHTLHILKGMKIFFQLYNDSEPRNIELEITKIRLSFYKRDFNLTKLLVYIMTKCREPYS
jgi:hypothetical protein